MEAKSSCIAEVEVVQLLKQVRYFVACFPSDASDMPVRFMN